MHPHTRPGTMAVASVFTSRRLRIALRLAVLAAFLAALHFGGSWLLGPIGSRFETAYETYGASALYTVVGVYVIALALPFVPGIEISLGLLMVFGHEGVAIVYGATLLALSLSYGAGRLVPLRWFARLSGWLHLQQGQALMQRLEPLGREERLRVLVETAPVRFVPFLLRHRYVTIAVAFNLPGNALVGGGGGIGVMAGMSGLFRFDRYLLTVCVAISPIPLAILAHAAW